LPCHFVQIRLRSDAAFGPSRYWGCGCATASYSAAGKRSQSERAGEAGNQRAGKAEADGAGENDGYIHKADGERFDLVDRDHALCPHPLGSIALRAGSVAARWRQQSIYEEKKRDAGFRLWDSYPSPRDASQQHSVRPPRSAALTRAADLPSQG
jgi:hypothetical protein